MKYFFSFSLLILINFSVALAEFGLEFGGYCYNIPTIQKLSEASEIFGYNKEFDYFASDLTRLRLRPVLNITENTRITAHYEADLMFTKIPMPMQTTSGRTNRQAVSLFNRFVNKDNVIAQQYIDMLYLKHIFNFGELIVGRQVLSWGVGRVWQPTDQFNPINPANFSKFEKDGADAVSFKYFLGNFSDLELVYNIRERLDESNYGSRFRTNFNKYDFSLIAGKFDNSWKGGLSFAGSLGGAGVRGEGIFSINRDWGDSNFTRFILGIDYQLTAKLYALAEYQFNGEGTTNKEKYDLVRLVKGEIQNVGNNYLTAQASYLVHPLVSIAVSGMANLNDRSGYAGITGSYNALENLDFRLGGILFYGGRFSEYWYYSSAVYLIGEIYF